MAVQHYQELIAWQKAMDLVLRVYRITEGLPDKERFGLTNQIRRAAVSIPSNIAEGQGRRAVREFLRFLGIARGSLQELETQTVIAHRLGYINESIYREVAESIVEVGRLIGGLQRSLSEREPH